MFVRQGNVLQDRSRVSRVLFALPILGETSAEITTAYTYTSTFRLPLPFSITTLRINQPSVMVIYNVDSRSQKSLVTPFLAG